MKNQKTQSKIIVAMSAVILLLVALSATLTFAWFSASQDSKNASMTFGTLGLNANNGFALTGDAHAFTEVIPGCTITIGGTVTLSGNINAFVRTQLKVFKLNPESGKTAAQYAELDSPVLGSAVGNYVKISELDSNSDAVDMYYTIAEVVSGYVAVETANVNTSASHTQVIFNKVYNAMNSVSDNHWISYTDGYVYYDHAVQADDDTVNTVLSFGQNGTAISLENTLNNNWQGEKFAISLGAQAIQAGHLTDGVAEADVFALEAGNDKKAVSALAGQAAWNA